VKYRGFFRDRCFLSKRMRRFAAHKQLIHKSQSPPNRNPAAIHTTAATSAVAATPALTRWTFGPKPKYRLRLCHRNKPSGASTDNQPTNGDAIDNTI
jgi:hypothetical protein